jgi:hypothetical protein
VVCTLAFADGINASSLACVNPYAVACFALAILGSLACSAVRLCTATVTVRHMCVSHYAVRAGDTLVVAMFSVPCRN